MSKKQEVKIKEIRVEKGAEGQVVLVTVYESHGEPKPQKVRFKHARQTNDFDLVAGWQRNRSKPPKC